MSPEPRHARRLTVATAGEPAAARVVPGGLDQALGQLVAAREDRARHEGRREASARARSSAAAALDAAVRRLDAAREEALGRLQHTAVELAVEIARCLLRAEIPSGRYDLEGIVREALSFSQSGRGRCVLHLNPADAEALAGVPFRSGTEIEPDPAVARGDVHVTTPQGLLVRDLDEALRSIGERIRGDLA